MPTTKVKSTRQLIASLLVDAAVPDGTPVYVVKTARADVTHSADKGCECLTCHPIRSTLTMYGVEFTNGVGISTDLELVKRIHAEFPDYTYSELI